MRTSASCNVDFMVLARSMQIISEQFIQEVNVPTINIYHSFLPAFIGAAPYARAKAKAKAKTKAKEHGVKQFGASARYVTGDLDGFPIIEGDAVRVSRTHTAADLQRHGADVERAVLSRAVAWHEEDRVIRPGNHTVVFN